MNADSLSILANPRHRLFPALHRLLAGVYVVVGLVCLLSLPEMYNMALASWEVSDAAGPLSNVIAFESLAAVVAFLYLAVIILYLATAALLLRQPVTSVTLLATLALTTLPLTFVLGDSPFALLPGPFDSLARGLVDVLGIVGVLAFLLLLFVFPDGRFMTGRARWLLIATLVALVIISLWPDLGDNGWFIFIGGIWLLLALAAASQVRRYRQADGAQRRQTRWFVIAALAFPLALVVAFIEVLPGSFLFFHIPILLLAASLAIAASRGVWGRPIPATSQWAYTGVVGLLLMAAGAASAYWHWETRPVAIDVAALDTDVKIPILLDVDMAMDDITALFYLLQHPTVDLRAITVNGVAFAHCDAGVRNTLGLLELARAPEIPVACGRDESYPGGTPAPAEWRTSADNLYGAQVMSRGRTPDERTAAELLADTIRAAPGGLVVIALGPLTNLAEAFQADPTLAGQIKALVIMGGALNVPGNVALEDGSITNQFAEWNFFADPVAADIVLASGAPITLVPLDATNDVPFTRGFYQQLKVNHATRPAVFTYNLMYLNQWWLDGGMYWWDTVTVAAALDNSLLTWREARLDVITENGLETGRVVDVADGSPVQVAVAADARRFEALLLALLNRH